MTIKEAKAIDMVAYLSSIGKQPAKIKGINYWYHSPFRSERTPSFKINRNKNCWFDYGEGKGGNLVDLLQQLEDLNITEILKRLSTSKHLIYIPDALPAAQPVIQLISVDEISSPALIQYYRSRHISDSMATQYLKEVHYKNAGQTYYALGFKNDHDGYELRSAYFKGSSHPKTVTHIKNDADSLAVFEGFFDFLSYLTIDQNQQTPVRDFLILNSSSFFESQLTNMQSYKQVHLYLDNDATGNKCTALALKRSAQQFIDERNLYTSHPDLNDWFVQVCNNQ